MAEILAKKNTDKLPANENIMSQTYGHPPNQVQNILNINKNIQSFSLKDWQLFFHEFYKIRSSGFPTSKEIISIISGKIPKHIESVILYLYIETTHGLTFTNALKKISFPKETIELLELSEKCGCFSSGCETLKKYYNWQVIHKQKIKTCVWLHIGFLFLLSCVSAVFYTSNLSAPYIALTPLISITMGFSFLFTISYLVLSFAYISKNINYRNKFIEFISNLPIIGSYMKSLALTKALFLVDNAEDLGANNNQIKLITDNILKNEIFLAKHINSSSLSAKEILLMISKNNFKEKNISASNISKFLDEKIRKDSTTQITFYLLTIVLLFISMIFIVNPR